MSTNLQRLQNRAQKLLEMSSDSEAQSPSTPSPQLDVPDVELLRKCLTLANQNKSLKNSLLEGRREKQETETRYRKAIENEKSKQESLKAKCQQLQEIIKRQDAIEIPTERQLQEALRASEQQNDKLQELLQKERKEHNILKAFIMETLPKVNAKILHFNSRLQSKIIEKR